MGITVDMLDKKEFSLAKSLSKDIEKNGIEYYLSFLKHRTYSTAEYIAKLSPNELLVFEDALKEFREVLDDKK